MITVPYTHHLSVTWTLEMRLPQNTHGNPIYLLILPKKKIETIEIKWAWKGAVVIQWIGQQWKHKNNTTFIKMDCVVPVHITIPFPQKVFRFEFHTTHPSGNTSLSSYSLYFPWPLHHNFHWHSMGWVWIFPGAAHYFGKSNLNQS